MFVDFILHQTDEGEFYTAPNISLPHRFTTKTGKPPVSPILAKQIHSADVLEIDGPGEYTGDGFLTTTPGLAIAVKTADCTPILLCDDQAGIVCAVHAGWRGTAAKIAPIALKQMLAKGASLARIQAAIGPAICFDCYQVGDDFRQAIIDGLGEEIAEQTIRPHSDGSLHADVPAMNVLLLRQAGLPDDNIAQCTLCTCHNRPRFYSYRGDKGYLGNQWAIISLPEA